MTEKIKDVLFRPKELGKLKDSKLYKAFLYLFIIAFLTSIIPIIDIIKFDGFDVYDRKTFETYSGVDLSVASDLPDCAITDYTMSCENQDGPIMKSFGQLDSLVPIEFNLVFDEASSFSDIEDDQVYLIFKNKGFSLNIGLSTYSFSYKAFPTLFNSLDFEEVRESSTPEDDLFEVLVGVVNELYRTNEVIIDFMYISFTYAISYVMTVLRVLFYSLLFLVFLIPDKVKYNQIFKVTTYAITFGTVVSLVLNLIEFEFLSTYAVFIITFIYVLRALRRRRTISS